MKKLLISIVAVLCLICLIFTGCTQTPPDYSGNTDNPSQGETTTPPNDDSDKTHTPTLGNNDILIVYFSRSGNTERMAQTIATITDSELFEIQPSIPYSTNYQETVNRHLRERDGNERPQIANTVENWTQYETVFIGFPLWSGNAPMIIRTFMESYDFSNKTVIPFGTSGGSSGSVAYANLSNNYPSVRFTEGLNLTGSQITNPEMHVRSWLTRLEII